MTDLRFSPEVLEHLREDVQRERERADSEHHLSRMTDRYLLEETYRMAVHVAAALLEIAAPSSPPEEESR
jgi:hypothetical protein